MAGQRPSLSEDVQAGSNVAEVRVTDLDYDGKDTVTCSLREPAAHNANDLSMNGDPMNSAKFILSERITLEPKVPRTFELKTKGTFDRETALLWTDYYYVQR